MKYQVGDMVKIEYRMSSLAILPNHFLCLLTKEMEYLDHGDKVYKITPINYHEYVYFGGFVREKKY